MSGSFSQTIIFTVGLAFLAAGCQPVQNKPLELRAPVAPEDAPDLSEYEVETLPVLPENTVTDTAANPDAPEPSSIVTLVQVITPIPEPAQPPLPAPPPQLEPASLVGRLPDQLYRQLGEPDYTRQEAKTEIWQYRLARCVVNFILSDDGKGKLVTSWVGRHRVLGLAYDHEACIRDLAERDQL